MTMVMMMVIVMMAMVIMVPVQISVSDDIEYIKHQPDDSKHYIIWHMATFEKS